jgi:hypothetical protein
MRFAHAQFLPSMTDATSPWERDMADAPEIQALFKQLDRLYAKRIAILHVLDGHTWQINSVRDSVSKLAGAPRPSTYSVATLEERATWKQKAPALKRKLTELKQKLDKDFPRLTASKK